jgi:hypothetical protein
MDPILVPLVDAVRHRQQDAFAKAGAVQTSVGSLAASVKAAAAAVSTVAEEAVRVVDAQAAASAADTELYTSVDALLAAADKLGVPVAPTDPPVPPVPPVPPEPPVDANTMPAAAPAGWVRRLGENFDTVVPRGSAKAHFGPKGWVFYDGTYPQMKDTSGRGTYDTALAVSVSGGVLSSRFGFKGSNPQIPYGSAILPLGWNGVLYGRFGVRFRVDPVIGRKIAWLLWPAPPNGWPQGEIDFPEGSAGGTIFGFNHDIGGDPSKNQLVVNTNTAMTGWHTAVIEWLPERLTFLLDDKVVGETRDRAKIPRVPFRWVLQSETNMSGQPIPTTSTGNAQMAWLTYDAPAA